MTDQMIEINETWKQESSYVVTCLSNRDMFAEGTARVPDELIDFFGADRREKRVVFLFEGREYPSYLESESMEGNFRLTWSKALSSKFIGLFPEYATFFDDMDDDKRERQPYFVIEKLEETEFAIKMILPMDEALTIKQSLFDFLGPGKSLVSFKDSYELLFLKNYLEQVDNRWRADVFMVSAGVKKFYAGRIKEGRDQDKNADKIIDNVGTAGLDEILSFLMDGPYITYSEPGFISMESVDDHFYFAMDNTLIDELSTDDRHLIIDLLDQKIKFYFDRLDGPGLQELLTQLVDEYADFFTKDFRYSFKDVLTDSIPGCIGGLSVMTEDRYKVVGFAGTEEWAEIPWIEIMDKAITRFPNTDTAIKFLLNKDSRKLYLVLSVGFKTIESNIIKNEGPQEGPALMAAVGRKLKEKVDLIKSLVNPGTFSSDNGEVDLKDERYRQGIAFFREYYGVVPGNNILETDIAEMMEIYDSYYHRCVLKEVPQPEMVPEEPEEAEEVPAADGEEAAEGEAAAAEGAQGDENPLEDGLDDDLADDLDEDDLDSLELDDEALEAGEATAEDDGLVEDFEDEEAEAPAEAGDDSAPPAPRPEGRPAAPVRDSWAPVQPAAQSVQVVSAGLTKKDILELQKAMIKAQLAAQRAAEKEKAKALEAAEAAAAKTEEEAEPQGRSRGDLYVEETLIDPPKDIAGTLRQITSYIASGGFTCEQSLVTDFYLCLKANPFVLVTGVAGAGKTTFVRLFAEALGANVDNGRFRLVPVRPGWQSADALLGAVDGNGRFIPGAILDTVATAVENPDKPYFLCFDEMTLQKTERYFSEILSLLGGRRKRDGRIVTDPLLGAEAFAMDGEARDYYGDLILPDNLFLVGTISYEEVADTGISSKLLDRSAVVELGQPSLQLVPAPNAAPQVFPVKSDFLRGDVFNLSTIVNHRERIMQVVMILDAMNSILAEAGAQIGFRVRNEICYYLYYNEEFGLMTYDKALDYAITQKILPRIEGSGEAIGQVLVGLFKICAGTEADAAIRSYPGTGGLFPMSAQKLSRMNAQLETIGKTSFWKQ